MTRIFHPVISALFLLSGCLVAVAGCAKDDAQSSKGGSYTAPKQVSAEDIKAKIEADPKMPESMKAQYKAQAERAGKK